MNGKTIWIQLFSTALIVTVLTYTATAQQSLTSADIAKLESASDAVIAPNGNHVAYVRNVPRIPLKDEDGPSHQHLHVVSADGIDRVYVAGPNDVDQLSWSSDGKFIYFISKRESDEHNTLYKIAIDGGEATIAFSHSGAVKSYDIAADGNRLLFLSTEDETKAEKELQEKGFKLEVYEEELKPVGLWIADLADPNAPVRRIELPGSTVAAKWSPEGEKIAVSVAPTSSVDSSMMRQTISVLDAVTGRILRTIPHSSKMGQFEWSSDGLHLAIIAGVDLNDPQEGHVLVVKEDNAIVDLTPDLEGHVSSLAWIDDHQLVWTVGTGTNTEIQVCNLVDQAILALKGTSEVIVSNIQVAHDGKSFSILGHSPQHPPEVLIGNLDSEKLQRLTICNPWLDDVQLGRQEAIEWQAADGLTLQGILIYPVDYREGERYPMIMSVHGGPEAHEPNGWLTTYSRPGQVAAGKGFFVFYPNYRGSTGRGVEFSKLGQADAAGKEFSDLIDGIDAIAERGLTDKDRVGITGGSYGGFASAWGATYYSDRFAASVMFVGISDNISKVGTTDIPEEMYLVHHRKHLWEDWNYFLERSPIKYVERNQTPTLILHGKNDTRVHPSQSLELYRHLKTLNQAPVRLVLYEGEGHGNRKAAAKLDYNLRMLQWMEHFLFQKSRELPPKDINYSEALHVPEKPHGSESTPP